MRPLIWVLLCWPAWLGAQATLDRDTIRMIRFDAADGTTLPDVFTSSGAGVPTLFGGVYQPGTTSLATNAIYAFTDPEDPDVRAFGFKRASNSNVAHLDLNLVNGTGRELRRLRVRMRVWQVSEQGRASAVSVRYVQYPVGASNSISQGPLFVATTGPSNVNLAPVRKGWIDHTIVMPTAIALDDTFRVGIHFANGDGSGANAHLAIEEIRLYPDFMPVMVSENSGWRMLAPPVEGSTAAEWNTYFGVQGAAGLPNAWADANLYAGYDGSAWVPASQSTASIPSGRGVIWYRFEGPEKEAGLFGHEPTAAVQVALHDHGDSWNLVGNPFLSAIRVDSLVGDADLPDVVAVWSPGEGGGPGSWVLSSDAALGGVIAPWQGFMIWNGGETPSSQLTIPLSAKTTGGTLLKDTSSWMALTIGLSRMRGSGWTVHDRGAQLWIGRRPRVAIPELPRLDAGTGTLSFAGQAIASLTEAEDGPVRFPIHLRVPESGWWRIDWSDHPPTDAWHLRLVDRTAGVETAFDEETGYGFESGPGEWQDRFEIVARRVTTSVDPLHSTHPESVRLLGAWPNPFNPTTDIGYQVSVSGQTRLAVHDVLGREVAVLVDGPMPPGEHRVRLDASGLASGIYLVRLQAGGRTDIRRITLLK